MDTPEDVANIHDPSIPPAFLKEPKESEECKGDASVDDHEHSGMVIVLMRKSLSLGKPP